MVSPPWFGLEEGIRTPTCFSFHSPLPTWACPAPPRRAQLLNARGQRPFPAGGDLGRQNRGLESGSQRAAEDWRGRTAPCPQSRKGRHLGFVLKDESEKGAEGNCLSRPASLSPPFPSGPPASTPRPHLLRQSRGVGRGDKGKSHRGRRRSLGGELRGLIYTGCARWKDAMCH